ncbi:MAG: sulfoxide reductase heme-binding subunit YedZ [Moraxellaceae bacterium]|jgi:sulfoxide reductase heme-binding subunit YedZ|nr:sulfoxide reductase heme-binding subunit YedZ [Moraxellaceae bacterium]
MSSEKTDWIGRSKILLLPLMLLPLGLALWQGLNGQSGPDPAKALVDQAGLWAFHFLLLSLAMTPLRLLTGYSGWVRYRRMLGLLALFHALVHVFSYTFLLFGARWSELAVEVTKRPYVMVGALALLLLLPLGLTSTRGWQRRLKRRWVKLHQLVYPIALLVLLHFAWVKKLGFEAVFSYAAVLFLLLGVRIWRYFQQSNRER